MYHSFTVFSMFFSLRLVCIESFVVFLMWFIFFYIKFAQNKNAKCCEESAQKWPTRPLVDRRWWASIKGSCIRKQLKEFRLSVGIQKYRQSVDWSTDRPGKSLMWSKNVLIPVLKKKQSMKWREALTDHRWIYRPCCWSVNWIRDDAKCRLWKDSKYGPTEAVDGPSVNRRTVYGGHWLKPWFGQTLLIWTPF